MTQKKLLILTGILMVGIAGWLYHTNKVIGPRIEAESGMIQGSIKVIKNGDFSGGAYVQAAGNRSNRITYLFQVDEPGIYKFRAKVYGHSENGDSFYVTIDDKKEMLWDVGPFNKTWQDTIMRYRPNPQNMRVALPVEVELMPGTHKLVIRERERRTGLDYFQLEMVRPIAVASFFNGFPLSQFVQGALALSLVALSLMMIGLVNRGGFLRRGMSKPADARLANVEKRLGDMQEVIISLDDKLKRMDNRLEQSLEPESVEKD